MHILRCTQKIRLNADFLPAGRLTLSPCRLGKSLEYCIEYDAIGSRVNCSMSDIEINLINTILNNCQ